MLPEALGCKPDDVLEFSLLDPTGAELAVPGYERQRRRADDTQAIIFPPLGVGAWVEWIRVTHGEPSFHVLIRASLDLPMGATATVNLDQNDPRIVGGRSGEVKSLAPEPKTQWARLLDDD